jgi:hypothetical protein
MVEFLAQVFGDDGADEEEGGGHDKVRKIGGAHLLTLRLLQLIRLHLIAVRKTN